MRQRLLEHFSFRIVGALKPRQDDEADHGRRPTLRSARVDRVARLRTASARLAVKALEPRQPHLCVSVGVVVQDDASAKVLAPNLGASNGGGGWDQGSGVINICFGQTLLTSPLLPILWLQAALLGLLGGLAPATAGHRLDPCQISTKRLNQGVICSLVGDPGGRRVADRAKEAGFRCGGAGAGAKCGTSYKAMAGAS